ncbi:Potassium/sodium hyperpolarization-activated cyclic nucleotide-gated channel 4 [Hondaea fermentalgiana]|uniref:Potassium/sodium hyperpolarization-activated cyclic nucleotide-gated channel 4 n=1 Tax=Hondaea fermentalgiana TaxID=2315210 RepID=A0A2R5G7I9_9STRA|nr:Potassium/sodium hyperpolarization-activated cyclic nucleotide-gated channel 4 [Hondaea fermentalgiana]|eukprot:GBG27007.1 Potassium/sodium hyperpolarization-activated cyclic nucleotide-gated channel 4 [Hondaea fermentalgiana]
MFGSTSIPSPSTLRARAANVGNFFSGLGSKMRRGSVTPLNMSMTSSFRKYGSALDNIQELNAAKKFSSQRHLAKCDGTDNEATAEEEEEAGVVGRKSSGSLGSNDAIEKRASADSLSELELRKLYPDLWESFRRYDADGDGTVTPDELVNYLEVELDSTIAVEDITKFFEAIDNNGDGYVSFKELADWYHSIVHSLDMGTESQQGGVTVGTIFDVTKFNLGDIAKSIRNVTHANSAPGLNSSDFEDWEEPSRWIVHPFSTFHVSWDLIISAVLVITLVTLPLSLAFENFNDAVSGFNLTVDIFFCLDIAKNFFTGYVDIDGVTHLEHRDIVRHYLLSWFMPDLVSSVPIDLVLDAFGDVEDDGLTRSTKGLKLIRLVRMTKLFRLLRMGRAAKFFAHWHRFIEDRLKIRIHDSTIRMLKLGVLLLVLAHWIGCLQFMMCRLMDFPASSWVVAAELDTMSESTQYSWSFFKALAQMIGIGFETPPITNLGCLDLTDSWCKIEMWITLSSMYLGSVFYAIMISNISSIIFSMNMASRLYQEKTQQLNEYMRSKRLPPHLRDRVRDYFSLRYSEGKIFNEEAIMKDLSPSLRRDIMFFTSRELFLKVPFFRECTGNGFISSLATSLTPMVAFQDDVILEEGSVGDSMFFISSGKILIYVEEYQKSPLDELPSLVQQQEMQQAREHPGKSKRDKASSRVSSSATSMMDEEAWLAPKTIALASISSGSFFGEVALILPVRRTASAKAIAVSILYMLDREALLTSLKDFPDIYARLRDIATSRESKDAMTEESGLKAISPLLRKVLSVVAVVAVWGVGIGLSFLGKGRADPFVPQLSILQTTLVLSFGINALVFVPSYVFQTERYFDLTGSLTYLTCTWYTFSAGLKSTEGVKLRSVLASVLVTIWAVRLGSFLFRRILRDGKDGRFDKIKPNFLYFFNVWNTQGLWVYVTAYAVYIANAATEDAKLGALDYVGLAVWAIGMGIEALADHQKTMWRQRPENKGQFIETGLWYYSRHPNYFGEWTLWTGMFLFCASTFEGMQWAAVLSPIFVFCLLNFVSGVPLLEKRADEKWGGQPDYENYKATTSVFFILPKLGKRSRESEALIR